MPRLLVTPGNDAATPPTFQYNAAPPEYRRSTYEASQRAFHIIILYFSFFYFNSFLLCTFFPSPTGVTVQQANTSHCIHPTNAEDARTYRLTLTGRSTL